MEFKTIQFQKNQFYDQKDFLNSKTTTIGTDFKIQFYWHPNINDKMKTKVEEAARNLCSIIKTNITHTIGVVEASFNQSSVELVLMPSYASFKDLYSKNIQNDIQKSILQYNLTLSEEQCDSVFYYTLAQLQAFGFNSKKINSFIGLNDDPSIKEITELILNTLGRLPSFYLKKTKLSYLSLLSLCSYKAENERTNSSEYGSYFSIDNGINSYGLFTDDDSFEFISEESNTLNILNALGYEIQLNYKENKFILNQNDEIKPLYNNMINFPFKKIFKIFPLLPKGLEFNSLTGTISGTPIVQLSNQIYLITMNDKMESLIEIQIHEQQQPSISISSSFMTATVILIIILLIFVCISIGYKAYH